MVGIFTQVACTSPCLDRRAHFLCMPAKSNCGWMVANWEVSAYARGRPAPDFALICATGASIWPFSPILPIQESITCVFSVAGEAVPFQNRSTLAEELL
jgi:hypothetical protein